MERSFPGGKFERRLLSITRALAVFAIAVTGLCATAIATWQLSLWVSAGSWNTVAMSHVFELANISPPRTYTPASANLDKPYRPDTDPVLEWLLDVPAIMPLMFALGLLTLFYIYVLSVEKEQAQARSR